jgi:hypothetical protein
VTTLIRINKEKVDSDVQEYTESLGDYWHISSDEFNFYAMLIFTKCKDFSYRTYFEFLTLNKNEYIDPSTLCPKCFTFEMKMRLVINKVSLSGD